MLDLHPLVPGLRRITALCVAALGLTLPIQGQNQVAGPLQYMGHTYILLGPGASPTWTGYEAEAIALGGHLVTINNADEQGWIWNTFGAPQSRHIFIGYTDASIEGTWVWAGPSNNGYENWQINEPNSLTGPAEDYAIMYPPFGGEWADADNNHTGNPTPYAVVEIEPGPIAGTETISKSAYFRLGPGPGTATWTNYEARAVALGGHLVTIETQQEQDLLWAAFSDGGTRHLFIGLTDQSTESQWTWASGSTAGYRNWAAGEPNSLTGPGEDYAIMYPPFSGEWADADNTHTGNPTPYAIVEIPPETIALSSLTNAGPNTTVAMSMDLAPGDYRIDHLSGCFNDDTAAGSWRADVRCQFNGETVELGAATGIPGPYASRSECDANYMDATIHASHAGGLVYFWLNDSNPGNNSNDTLTFELVRIPDTAPTYTAPGTESPTSVSTPSLRTNEASRAGAAGFELLGEGLVPLSAAFLLLNVGDFALPGTPIPGAPPAARIYVPQPFLATLLIADSTGEASYALPLPPTLAFVGLPIVSQLIDLDLTGLSPQWSTPVGTSRAMRLVIR